MQAMCLRVSLHPATSTVGPPRSGLVGYRPERKATMRALRKESIGTPALASTCQFMQAVSHRCTAPQYTLKEQKPTLMRQMDLNAKSETAFMGAVISAVSRA